MESFAQHLTERSFWLSLAPALRIEDRSSFNGIRAWDAGRDGASLTTELDRDGYVHLPRCQGEDRTRPMADAVIRLVESGIPAPFCMVFDEFWLPAFSLSKIVTVALGGSYQLLPDFWIWHIDPSKGETGWSPHRDKDYRALFPDRRPKAVTAWLALSDAGPLNSCMYIVPADRDPTYGTERDGEWTFAYPDIRALPAASGDVYLWNQAVLHWGSHASPRAARPRISMAFEFQRADVAPYNQPLISPTTILRFEDRLKLIGKQVIQYSHMYPVTAEMEAAARALIAGPFERDPRR
jgi:hypothetical protein